MSSLFDKKFSNRAIIVDSNEESFEVNLSLMFGKDNAMILLKRLNDREVLLLKKLNHDCDVLLFHLSNVF